MGEHFISAIFLILIMTSYNQEILNEYLSIRSITPTTQRLYTQAVDSWDKYNTTPLGEMTREHLLHWYREIQQEAKSGTIVKYASNLRRIYEYLLLESGLSKRQAATDAKELFDAIPFTDLRQTEKKEQKIRDKLVTHDEFTKLLNGTSSVRTRALIAVTYESGCRKGEIFTLRLKDIVRRENHWAIRVEGKTGVRTVPIVSSIPYVKAWLQLHPDRENENQYLFVNNRGSEIKPLHPNGFNTTLSKLSKKLRLRRIHPHMLRHTRLTNLAEEGLGEFQMKSFAGWTADSNMAAKYIHLTGTSHVNAVLETQGIDSENGEQTKPEPFLKLVECPNCGRGVDDSMVVCPYCQFILDDSVGLSQDNRVAELEATIEQLLKSQEVLVKGMKELEKRINL